MNQLFRILFCFLASFILFSCKQDREKEPVTTSIQKELSTLPASPKVKIKKELDYDTLAWSEITEADSIYLDLRYATENNFTKTQIYDCARCFLRPEVALRVRRINYFLHRKYNWRLKVFDCYRPRPYQQKLWDIVPNPIYVSNPKKGSMHNRGAALDLTIVDADGKELDMGTDFDYFGREAHTDFVDLPDTVLQNRAILKEIMLGNGFKGIQSEWWHYSISGLGSELSEWVWPCNL